VDRSRASRASSSRASSDLASKVNISRDSAIRIDKSRPFFDSYGAASSYGEAVAIFQS
jgi:hypothetical protein